MCHFNTAANQWDTPDKIKMMETLAANTIEVLKIKSELKDLKVLDFGCGTGLFGLNFLDYASTLMGIDTSEGMLKVFDEKTRDREHPEISRKLTNLEKENLDERFDLVVSSMTFHHLNNPREMIKKIKAMLTPSGQMAIVDLDKEDGSFHPDNEGMGVKHFGFSKEELSSWAGENNLSFDHRIINTIEKNERSYGQFLAVFSLF